MTNNSIEDVRSRQQQRIRRCEQNQIQQLIEIKMKEIKLHRSNK
jgi:hypothetical protein